MQMDLNSAITAPNLLVLFEDWFEEMEEEVISFAKQHGPLNPEELAEKIGISLRGAAFLLADLNREGTLSKESEEGTG
jgi:predicted ArsR family transcriptional regulator